MQMSSNAEEEARLVRGRESQSEHIIDSNVNRKFGSTSGSIRDQSVRTDRDNGSSRSFTNNGEDVIGKIVTHLISECRNQVAVKQNEIGHLEIKIQEFEALLKDIEPSTEKENE